MHFNEFAKAAHIFLSSTRIPYGVSGEHWSDEACHWHCTLYRNTNVLANGSIIPVYTFEYSRGSHWRDRPNPSISEVLESLQRDVLGSDEPFEDWAEAMGLSDDSIRAKGTYDACGQTARALMKGMGEKLYNQFLEATEEE